MDYLNDILETNRFVISGECKCDFLKLIMHKPAKIIKVFG